MRLVCALLLGLGCPVIAQADCPDVRLELQLKKSASGLEIDATLKNTGKAAIELMATGDGSSFGKRNPSLTFTLEPNLISEVGTCGFINALADEDFLTLRPGQSRKLGWVHPPTPGKPGQYTLQVTYSNDPAAPPVGSGAPRPPTPAQLDRLAKTVACKVVSEPLRFRWDGKRASK